MNHFRYVNFLHFSFDSFRLLIVFIIIECRWMCRNWHPFPVYEFSVSPHTLPTTSTRTMLSVLTLSCLCLFYRMLSRGTAVHIVCLSFVREVSGLTGYTYVCVCVYVCMYFCIYTHPALLVLLCMFCTLLISSALLFIITAFEAASGIAYTWKTRPRRLISVWVLEQWFAR
jgi:hypothetical protein